MRLIDKVYAIKIEDVWPLAYKTNPEFQTLGGLISYFLPRILLLGGIISFVIVVVAGLGVISGAASGDAHATESRKNILTYAIVGLVLMFGAYWVLQIINFITGGSLKGILK